MKHPSWTRLQEAHSLLMAGEDVSDDELIEIATSLKIVTNAGYSAFLLFKAIAPICCYRQHLTYVLGYRPMLPLVYIGVTTAHEVEYWLNSYLSQPDPFDGMESKAIEWIKWFSKQEDLIQEYLDIEIANNDKYFIDQFKDYLMPYSKLAEEYIKFQIRWDDKILDSQCAILFFDFSFDEEIEDANFIDFETLTLGIAEVDINHEIDFYACEREVWWDLSEILKQRDSKIVQWIGVENPDRVQTIWILNGQVMHTIESTDRDRSLYIQYTQDLIKRNYS